MSVKAHHGRLLKNARISHPEKAPDKPIRSPKRAVETAESLNTAFEDWVRLGMCEWRHGLGDARKTLEIAYGAAVRAAEILQPYHEPHSAFMPFWFAPSVYIARLVTGSFDQQLVGMLPAFSSWRSTALVTSYFDVAHMIALQSQSYPLDWPELVHTFSSETGHELFCETHQCYARIIEKTINHQHSMAIEDINSAYDLFSRRETDDFSINSRLTEGGGPDNPFSVDYRLAALIEHCFLGRKQLLKGLPRDHIWPF